MTLPYDSLNPTLVNLIRAGGGHHETLEALGIVDEGGTLTKYGERIRRALGDIGTMYPGFPEVCSICHESFGSMMMAWDLHDWSSDLGTHLPCIYCAMEDKHA